MTLGAATVSTGQLNPLGKSGRHAPCETLNWQSKTSYTSTTPPVQIHQRSTFHVGQPGHRASGPDCFSTPLEDMLDGQWIINSLLQGIVTRHEMPSSSCCAHQLPIMPKLFFFTKVEESDDDSGKLQNTKHLHTLKCFSSPQPVLSSKAANRVHTQKATALAFWDQRLSYDQSCYTVFQSDVTRGSSAESTTWQVAGRRNDHRTLHFQMFRRGSLDEWLVPHPPQVPLPNKGKHAFSKTTYRNTQKRTHA